MTIFEAVAFFNLGNAYSLADLNKAHHKAEQRFRTSQQRCTQVKYRCHVLYKTNITRDQIDSAYNICYNYLCYYGTLTQNKTESIRIDLSVVLSGNPGR